MTRESRRAILTSAKYPGGDVTLSTIDRARLVCAHKGSRRDRAMIVRLLMVLALVFGVAPAMAQEINCSFYRVNTSLLNINQEPGADTYIDVLEDGEIACVTKQQKANGGDWVFIAFKLDKKNAREAVDGWASQRFLKELSPAEAAAAGAAAAGKPAIAAAAPAPAPISAPSSAVAPAPTPAPPPAAVAAAPAPIRAEELLRFDQPVPFGPFPVNGSTIKALAEGVPLFPPIEGLDEALWKKSCTSCHKWDKARLCDQGATYVKAPKNVLRHPHPYGGAYKIALMRWAKSGCE